MKKIFLLLGLFGFAAIASSAVCAGNRPGAITLTVADGYYSYASKRHLQDSSIPNAAIAYNFNERWAVEGDVGVLNTQQQAPLPEQGVHGALYTLYGIYRFLPYKVVEPYVSAGVGILSLSPNGYNSEHEGNVNVGLGVQVFLDPSIALRGEVRDIYTLSGGFNDGMANFGISLLFDT